MLPASPVAVCRSISRRSSFLNRHSNRWSSPIAVSQIEPKLLLAPCFSPAAAVYCSYLQSPGTPYRFQICILFTPSLLIFFRPCAAAVLFAPPSFTVLSLPYTAGNIHTTTSSTEVKMVEKEAKRTRA